MLNTLKRIVEYFFVLARRVPDSSQQFPSGRRILFDRLACMRAYLLEQVFVKRMPLPLVVSVLGRGLARKVRVSPKGGDWDPEAEVCPTSHTERVRQLFCSYHRERERCRHL